MQSEESFPFFKIPKERMSPLDYSQFLFDEYFYPLIIGDVKDPFTWGYEFNDIFAERLGESVESFLDNTKTYLYRGFHFSLEQVIKQCESFDNFVYYVNRVINSSISKKGEPYSFNALQSALHFATSQEFENSEIGILLIIDPIGVKSSWGQDSQSGPVEECEIRPNEMTNVKVAGVLLAISKKIKAPKNLIPVGKDIIDYFSLDSYYKIQWPYSAVILHKNTDFSATNGKLSYNISLKYKHKFGKIESKHNWYFFK